MYTNFIGKKSDPIRNIVEKEKVETFINALGDLNPVYYDKRFVLTTPFKKPIAPPTFPRTFDYGKIDGVTLPKAGLINGEQSFHYNRPIFIGEDLYCQWMISGVEIKETRNGSMTFIELKHWGFDVEGKEVFTAKKISIMSEIVGERLKIEP